MDFRWGLGLDWMVWYWLEGLVSIGGADPPCHNPSKLPKKSADWASDWGVYSKHDKMELNTQEACTAHYEAKGEFLTYGGAWFGPPT